MTILFAANDYFVHGRAAGGFPIYLYRVTTALAGLGHTPIVVACGKQNKFYMDNGIEMYIVRCVPHEILMKGLAEEYRTLYRSYVINKKIDEILKKKKVDIIQFTSISALAVCYHGKVPAVMRLSSYTKTYYESYQTFDKQKVKIKAFFERRAATRCNAVFAPCRITAEDFSRDIGRNVSIIETPFLNDVDTYDESIFCDFLKTKKYVLFFGVLIVEKGVLVIADTLQRFLEKNPEHYVVCCGKSTLIQGKNAVGILRKASAQYRSRFIYLNELPHEQLYPIIQNADFVILPSLLDNMPNACIEAMYFEKVVIGTDNTSLAELITDGKNGFLCRPNDADSLLTKMNEAAAMSEMQKTEMGRNARKRVDRLAPEYVVKKLLRYYQYVIENVTR